MRVPRGPASALTAALPLVAVLALVLVAVLVPVAQAKPSALKEAHERGLEFLAAQGGSGPYPAGLAPYAVEAAHAAGLDPAAWPDPSRAALDSVEVPPPEEPFLRLVRPAYALALAGRLHDWHGEDIEGRLRAGFDGAQFGDPGLLNDDLFAGFALSADGNTVHDDEALGAAAEFLVSNQNEDGGWGYAVDGASAVDTTAMAVLFLQRSQATADGTLYDVAMRAVEFVLSAQDPATGGFAETPGGEPNCDSTAWALRIYLDGRGLDAWDYLLGLQGDDGGFAYKARQASNALCTVEAVTLLGDALRGRAPPPPEERSWLDAPTLAPAILVAGLLLAARRFRPI